MYYSHIRIKWGGYNKWGAVIFRNSQMGGVEINGGVDKFFKNRLKKVQNSLKMAFFYTFFEKFTKLKIENPKFKNGGGSK